MRIAFVLVVLSWLAGCAGQPLIPRAANQATVERARQVTVGMTLAEVEAFVGKAQNRQTNGNREVWQYCQTGITDYYGIIVGIWFRDGKVTSTDRITETRKGHCTMFFRMVKWNESEQSR